MEYVIQVSFKATHHQYYLSLVSFSPCLQRQTEAVRLSIGQPNDWNSLLSQQRLRHCDVSTYTKFLEKIA